MQANNFPISQSALQYQQTGTLIARLAPIKEDSYEVKIGPGSYDPMTPLPVVNGPSAWALSKDKRTLWKENPDDSRSNYNMRVFKTQQQSVDNSMNDSKDQSVEHYSGSPYQTVDQSAGSGITERTAATQKSVKFDVRKALRRAQQIKRRWRNGQGPHSLNNAEINERLMNSTHSSLEEGYSIEKQLLREHLHERNEMPGPGQYYSYEKFSTLNVKKKDVRH